MFIIETRATKSILCTDGEFHAPNLVGPAGWSPKTWKTEKGARQFAMERWNGGRVPRVDIAELDVNGCIKRNTAT